MRLLWENDGSSWDSAGWFMCLCWLLETRSILMCFFIMKFLVPFLSRRVWFWVPSLKWLPSKALRTSLGFILANRQRIKTGGPWLTNENEQVPILVWCQPSMVGWGRFWLTTNQQEWLISLGSRAPLDSSATCSGLLEKSWVVGYTRRGRRGLLVMCRGCQTPAVLDESVLFGDQPWRFPIGARLVDCRIGVSLDLLSPFLGLFW